MKTQAEMRKAREDATLESAIERYFLRVAKKYPCRQRKITQYYAEDGWPDRLLVWEDGKGTTDWVELKRPKGANFEPRQKEIQAWLVRAGCCVQTLYDKAEVDEYFRIRAWRLGVQKLAEPPKGTKLQSASEFLAKHRS